MNHLPMPGQGLLPLQPPDLTDQSTLGEVKTWLGWRLQDGTRCPACHQHAKVYRRKMNSGMARVLVLMYARAGLAWQKTRDLDNSGTIAKCAYWGLVEPGQRGTWRVTLRGSAFVNGLSEEPSHAEVYDGRLLGLDRATRITIHDALGDRFDYAELMATPARSTVAL